MYFIGMIVLTVPAMAAFVRFGFKKTVGFGILIAAVGAMARGIWGTSYIAVIGFTVLLSIAQPFIINAVAMVAGNWFPAHERALANWLSMLANYIGIMVGLLITPLILENGIELPKIFDGGTDS